MGDCQKHYMCVPPDDFKGLGSTLAWAILAGALTAVEVVAAVVAGAPIPGLGIVAGVAFVVTVFELCRFLHGGKLVCIRDDTCTIGRIMEFVPVGADKSGFEEMEDDFTFNLLPSPHSPVEEPSEVFAVDPQQGPFVQEQPASADLGLGYAGQSVKFTDIDHDTEVLHSEVKGCRVHDVCAVLKVLSFGAPVVGAICSIPVIGWVACAARSCPFSAGDPLGAAAPRREPGRER